MENTRIENILELDRQEMMESFNDSEYRFDNVLEFEETDEWKNQLHNTMRTIEKMRDEIRNVKRELTKMNRELVKRQERVQYLLDRAYINFDIENVEL